jgi:hypothetical protein
MGAQARHPCKLEHVAAAQWTEWFIAAQSANLCTPECFRALTEEKPRLLQIRASDLRGTEGWLLLDHDFKERLIDELTFISVVGSLISA